MKMEDEDMKTQVEKIRNLFKGRTDAWGSETGDGSGRCNKTILKDNHFRDHIKGKRRLGIYPLLDDGTCYWAAIDLDVDNQEIALAIRAKAGEYGLKGYIEISKSKGYHIFYFFKDKVPSNKIRLILKQLSLDIKRDFSGARIEIFPKQDTPISKGNFIYLPYFRKDGNEKNRFIDEDPLVKCEKASIQQIEDVIEINKLESEALAQVAGMGKVEEDIKPGLDLIRKSCTFFKYCEENEGDLSEILWFNWISNAIVFKGGREYIHRYSKDYQKAGKRYSAQETDAKIDSILLNAPGCHLCTTIKEGGFECPKFEECQGLGIKTPQGLIKDGMLASGTKFFRGLGTVREASSGYELRKEDAEGTVSWIPITNFIIRYDQIMKSIEDIDEVHVKGRIVFTGKSYSFIWPIEVLSDPRTFRTALTKRSPTGLNYSPKDLSHLLVITNNFNIKAPEVEALQSIGQHGNAFVTESFVISNGKIEPNTKYPVIPQRYTSLKKYDFVQMEEEKLKEAAEFIIEKLVNLHSHSITLPLLGEIGRCPLIPKIGDMRYLSFLEGETNVGKTLIQKALLNFYCDMPLKILDLGDTSQGLISSSSTVNQIERHGYTIINAPLIWDDFKIASQKDLSSVVRMLQNYYDQKGRGRLTREIKERKTYFIRANLWGNGEDFPEGIASIVTRCLIYRVDKGLNLDLIDEIEAKRNLLRGLTPHYIAWCQENGPKLWDGKLDVKHSRLSPFAKQNLTGLKSFFHYLKELGVSKDKLVKLFTEGVNAINLMLRSTESRATAEGTVEVFIDSLRELLFSKACVLGEPDKGQISIGKDVPEYKQVFILPKKAIEVVSRLHGGKRLYSTQSLGKNLMEHDYIVETRNDGRPSKHKKIDNNTVTVWVFDRRKLLEEEIEEEDEKHGFGELEL